MLGVSMSLTVIIPEYRHTLNTNEAWQTLIFLFIGVFSKGGTYMEYRRSRRRTNKRTSTGAGKTVVILILLAAGVYFISISAVGSWLSKHIVEPVFSAFMSEKK